MSIVEVHDVAEQIFRLRLEPIEPKIKMASAFTFRPLKPIDFIGLQLHKQVPSSSSNKRRFEEDPLTSHCKVLAPCNIIENVCEPLFSDDAQPSKRCRKEVAEDLIGAMFAEDDDIFGDACAFDSIHSFLKAPSSTFFSGMLEMEQDKMNSQL